MPRWDFRPPAGLVAACLLLLGLLAAGFATSTPLRSPARAWATLAWQARYRVSDADTTGTALSELHKDAASRTREQCVACHGDMTESKLPLHRIHLRSALLPDIACHECHQHVDLRARSTTQPATWVDVGFCKSCHSAFPGLHSESHMRPEDLEADCTMCHTGARTPDHAQPYLSQIIPSSECKGCHGGRVLPWTPQHEQDDWLRTHGAEALAVGTRTCFECHDFGLKFCDDCHAKTPPSHFPEGQWRALHPDAARADTRVCYTCHNTSYCKNCHVNHEAGWLKSHPAFVYERGDESCSECHSESSCAYCHTSLAESSPSSPGAP